MASFRPCRRTSDTEFWRKKMKLPSDSPRIIGFFFGEGTMCGWVSTSNEIAIRFTENYWLFFWWMHYVWVGEHIKWNCHQIHRELLAFFGEGTMYVWVGEHIKWMWRKFVLFVIFEALIICFFHNICFYYKRMSWFHTQSLLLPCFVRLRFIVLRFHSQCATKYPF